MTGTETLELIDRELAELEGEVAEVEAIAELSTTSPTIPWAWLLVGAAMGAGIVAIAFGLS